LLIFFECLPWLGNRSVRMAPGAEPTTTNANAAIRARFICGWFISRRRRHVKTKTNGLLAGDIGKDFLQLFS
jgi:hypothetical protein